MPKLSPEVKLAKAIVKQVYTPKVEVKGTSIRFHLVDNERLIELVQASGIPNTYSFLVFDNEKKTAEISPNYLTKEGVMIYPPSKDEEFLKNLLIPQVETEKKVLEDLKNFDSNKLSDEIDDFLKKWFILPDEYFLILRLFIKFSWVIEQSYFMPYLSLWGDRGTGKTMVGIFLSWLCRFPYFNKSGATPAVLARSLDLLKGVAIIDESDMYLNVTEETAAFMRILRGYHADSTYDVVDERKKTKFPKRFYTGFPKVIFSAKPIKDDHLSSRCIILELKPAKVPPEMIRDSKNAFWKARREEAQLLVNQLLIFRLYKFFDTVTPKTVIEGVEPRYDDVAMPLFYMVEEDKKEEHQMFYNFVIKNVETDLEQRSETSEGQILSVIMKLLESDNSDGRVFIEDIVNKIKETYYSNANERETEKWVNNRKIGWTLKGMGIKTKKDSASQGRKYLSEESLKLLPSLYSRFGVKKDEENEGGENSFLTSQTKENILTINKEKDEETL